jgi:hypothetical protein
MAGPEEELKRALATLVEEARANVAAGRPPNTAGLEGRIEAAARQARAAGGNPMLVGRQVAATRRRLAQVAAVHRSRALVAREPVQRAAPLRRTPAALRTKPTVTGTLGVRRAEGDGFRLVWDAAPLVTEWEVRFSERADARSDYVDGETVVLPSGATGVDVPLGDNLLRVNILGRGRGGRLLRRALISGLTRDGWRDRWQRRASAS